MFKISDLVVIREDAIILFENNDEKFIVVKGMTGKIVGRGNHRILVEFHKKIYRGKKFNYSGIKARKDYCVWIHSYNLRPANFKELIKYKNVQKLPRT